jgi:hypothetical protein
MAMITASRTSAGGDDYVYMVLQTTDDLTNGVNYSGHSNPRLAIGWDQFGGNQGVVSVGDAAFVVGSRSFSDIFPAVKGRIYSEGIIDAGGDFVTSTGNAKIGNGAVIGSSSASPGYGDLRVGGGIYVGSTGSDAATGNVQITGDFISNNGGIGLGNSGFNPGNGQIVWDARTSGAGLRPWDGGTYYQAYGYVPLQSYLSYVEGGTLTGGPTSGTAITLPTSVPYYAKAVSLIITLTCTAAGGWVTVGPGNSGNGLHHVSAYHGAANQYGSQGGICAIDSANPRRLYRSHHAQGGTITYWLRITGYFI